MSDKQTIKQRVDGIFKRNKTYYKNGSYGYNIEDIKQELDKTYHDHFIEMIDEEINKQNKAVYLCQGKIIKSLNSVKSKLMEIIWMKQLRQEYLSVVV